MRFIGILAVFLYLQVAATAHALEDDHEHEKEKGVIELDIEERHEAGVEIGSVALRALDETIRIPGEVVANAYRSSRVTPRIASQIVARHVKLGDEVEPGQRLLTLSSVEMAAAQGALIIADREWQRVENLGRETVSARRYTEAQVAQQQALATVVAYGMTEMQAATLTMSQDASKATGEFDLLATQAGIVAQDEFIVGEFVEPGRVLIDITDESVIWVEAQTTPDQITEVTRGSPARVSLDGEKWYDGTVIQQHHQLDDVTRTRSLRIEVVNTEDRLHPGQFVEAKIVTGTNFPLLAVPNSALSMIDGASIAFRLEGDHEFHAETVETGSTIGDWTVIEAGLAEGDQIAISGVFHLKSLQLKSSIGEGHAH